MTTEKPHAVCIPFPAQSHIKGIMKLAKLLHSRGFYITFVNTEINQKRLVKANGSEKLEALPDFKFETIPDGLPPSNPEDVQDYIVLCGSIRKNFSSPFCQLIQKLNNSVTCPPVTCILSDGVMPFTVTAGKELGIPVAMFWTLSACAFTGFYQFRALLGKGLAPVNDESYLTNEFLDTKVDWVPGMEGTKLKDLPTVVQTTDQNNEVLNIALDAIEAAVEATIFGLHTFDALEMNVLNTLSSIVPCVYTIGPLQLLLNQASENDKLDSLGYNLLKEDSTCLEWLDTREPGSVLYINFGSVIIMSPEKLVEFAWGLANSNTYFLWVIRPNLVVGDTSILPREFSERIKEKGLIASWCPQEEVLNHRAIRGFLTHSGWNSTIESLSAGVPMICWPGAGDQQTNCRLVCNEWEVGMEINSNVRRDDVETVIRELMEGEKGKKMKNKAMEWKTMAAQATSPGGSSSIKLDKLVNALLSKK